MNRIFRSHREIFKHFLP